MDELERAHNRLPLESRVYVEREASASGDEGDALVCHTLDVSARGLQVALDEELTEGAFLQIGIDFPGEAGEETLYLVGQVCWCRPARRGDPAWLAGFALLPAEDSDLDRWEALIRARRWS